MLLLLILSFHTTHQTLAQADSPSNMRIGSGSQISAYFAFTQNLAGYISDHGLTISNHSTTGSVENLSLLKEGKLDAALVQNDIAYYHYYDKQQPNQSFGTALPLFPEYFQIIVRKDSGILHIDSLMGKKIAIGALGSGTFRNAKDTLKAAEINFTPYPTANLEEALEKLQRGEVDAVCYTAASPPTVLRTPDTQLTVLSLPDSLIDKLVSQYPYYHKGHMPRKGEDSISTISLKAYLVLANKAPPEVAEKLIALIFNNWNTLADSNIYQLIPLNNLSQAIQRKPVPMHHTAQSVLIDKGYLFDPLTIAYYLLALIVFTMLVHFFSHKLTTRCDRLGNLRPIKSLWRYRFNLFVQGLAVFTGILMVMLLIYLGLMMTIQYYEARYAIQNNLYNPFVTMTIPDLMLWLWAWIGGYDSGIFPQSTVGKILAVFPPLVGFFTIVWVTYSVWRDIITRRVAQQIGCFVPPHKKHVVICGWNDKARGIIFGLTTHYAPERKKIVVIAQMDDEKPMEKFNFPKGMVHYYRGDSSDCKVLEASHIASASTALILAGEKKAQARNVSSVLTTLAIKRLNTNVFTVAELKYLDNMQKFEDCGIDVLVFADTIVYRLMAQTCFNPLAVSWFLDMITHDKHTELYAIPWKEVERKNVYRAVSEVLQQKKNLSSLYKVVSLLIKSITWGGNKTRHLNKTTPDEAARIMTDSGLSLLAIYHAGKDSKDDALLQHTFSNDRYTNFASTVSSEPLHKNDILIYSALEKEDITFPFLNTKSPDGDIVPTQLQLLRKLEKQPQNNCELLLIGNIGKCSGIIEEIGHMKYLSYKAVTENMTDKQQTDDPCMTTVDDLLNFTHLNQHLNENTNVVIILADTTGSENTSLEQDRGELDAKTLLIARHISRRFGENGKKDKPQIIAEMLGRNTRELFIGAGVDVVIPRNLLVERLMIKMTYGYGVVSNYLMAVLAFNDNACLNSITLAATDTTWLSLGYAELLQRMPTGQHLLAIYPANKRIQRELVNVLQDFEQHYLACPAHGEQYRYRSQSGDVLLVLDGERT